MRRKLLLMSSIVIYFAKDRWRTQHIKSNKNYWSVPPPIMQSLTKKCGEKKHLKAPPQKNLIEACHPGLQIDITKCRIAFLAPETFFPFLNEISWQGSFFKPSFYPRKWRVLLWTVPKLLKLSCKEGVATYQWRPG